MALVTIITPPAKTRWATPAQVAARLGLATDGPTLAVLGDLIDEQGGIAERIVGRPVCRTRYLERVPGRGTRFLKLSRGPVEVINSITFRGDVVDPVSYYVADPRRALVGRTLDHGFPLESWELTADRVGRSETIPMGGDPRPDYAVDYVAGYVMPEDDQSLATPPAPGVALTPWLRGAVIDLVRGSYYASQRDPLVRSFIKADRTVVFFGNTGSRGALPDPTETALTDERDAI